MGVSKNRGGPQIIHLFIGFSIIFTIHFGVFPPIFGNIPILGGFDVGAINPLFIDILLKSDVFFCDEAHHGNSPIHQKKI